MYRRLAGLFLLCLSPLALAATPALDPKAYYSCVLAHDRPASWKEDAWVFFAQNTLRMNRRARQDGNTILYTHERVSGKYVLGCLDPNDIGNKFIPYRLVSCELQESDEDKAAQEKAKAEAETARKQQEAEAKARQKLADENDPRRLVDAKGKPVYNAGSAEAQLRQSAQEQDKSAAKFKQYSSGGNGPVTGEGLIGKPVRDTGVFAEEEEPGERPAPAPTNKFAKPQPKQGTKKDDTLFKNQRGAEPAQVTPEKPAQPAEYRNPFMPCWADPQDHGFGTGDNRRVLVRLPGQKPLSLSLRDAKIAGYVAPEVTYSSLPKAPY